MASYTPDHACHKTLSGTTADLVTPSGVSAAKVSNRGAGTIYVRNDGVTAVAAANETVHVAPGGWVVVAVGSGLSIVGNGDAYSVEGVSS